jgi:hypothetical protein
MGRIPDARIEPTAMVRPSAPPILLNKKDAAAAMGMSVRHFDRHVHGQVPVVYAGQLHLYPVKGLEAWAMKVASVGGRAT